MGKRPGSHGPQGPETGNDQRPACNYAGSARLDRRRRSPPRGRRSRGLTMNAPAGLPPLPTVADVEDAARRLRGVAVRTPLLESPLLHERLGGRLLVKAEPLQPTGSFKFRGAYNRIDRKSGV